MIINDLVGPVINKLRGRSDVTTSCPYYIAQALIDISQNYEFEELKVTGPLTNFVTNIARYPLNGYDPTGQNGNPFIQNPNDRITFLRNWFRYFDTSGVVTPGVSTGSEIENRDIRVVEPMSKILGLPTLACISGTPTENGYILVGAMPDNPYPTQLTYQREHPFNVPYESVLQSQGSLQLSKLVGASKIYLSKDWIEIVILSAAEKACYDIGMNEIGNSYHQQIYGYKDKKGNELPGIITARMLQQDRQSSYNQRQLKIVVRRSCR